MHEKIKKFNKFEKIFFRIHLVVSGIGLFVLGSMYLLLNSIEEIAKSALNVILFGFYVIIINFFISVIRILKAVFGFRDIEERPSIKRSLGIMLTSPIAFGVYLIIILAMSLSMASCVY